MEEMSALPRIASFMFFLGLCSCDEPKVDPVAAAVQPAEVSATREQVQTRLDNQIKLLRADFARRQAEVSRDKGATLNSDEEVQTLRAAEQARAEAMKGLEKASGLKIPIAASNLSKRILGREGEILDAENEAKQVKASAYGDSEIAQYRVEQLGVRIARLRDEIIALRALLDKEVDRPQQAQTGAQARSDHRKSRPKALDG